MLKILIWQAENTCTANYHFSETFGHIWGILKLNDNQKELMFYNVVMKSNDVSH